jgi:tRNA (guanine-N7-)-methyltransferase
VTSTPPKSFRIRSFVRRDGRRTVAQERAYAALWPQYGLTVEQGLLQIEKIFGRKAPCFLEIGFGSGQSLLALAKAQRDINLIGVETHKPGVGALFLGIQQENLTNIRVFYQDVVDVLEKSIPDASLDGVQIFFPDPWPKRRHHQRRLIQPEFVRLIVSKLKPDGLVYLATDWEDYAKHMMQVMSQETMLENKAGVNKFADRSPNRPILTKFERRAGREGRSVWELEFLKNR